MSLIIDGSALETCRFCSRAMISGIPTFGPRFRRIEADG
jgi:hypothetical protein